MSAEPAVLVLLRETLEREAPGAAASLLFEALGRFGPRVPASFAEVLDFTHGPLRACMTSRLGEERARAGVRAIDRALRLAEMPTGQLASLSFRAFDHETTKSLARVEGALVIAVVATSGLLAERIAAVLDASRTSIATIRRPEELARGPVRAHLALIDASDPLDVEPGALAAALSEVSLVLVWDSDATGADRIASSLERAKIPVMTFARGEVDPMIDVLRARVGSTRLPPPWS